jgi:hypothetical protein
MALNFKVSALSDELNENGTIISILGSGLSTLGM